MVQPGPLGAVKGTLTDTGGKLMGAVDVSIRPVVVVGSELERFANPSGKRCGPTARAGSP